MVERRSWLAVSAVVLLCMAVYLPVGGYDFIDYDDPGYVAKNEHVLGGLTGEGVAWAFTTFRQSNYHPLTWLSHMFDVELFGAGPAGPHLTNVLLHTANSVLLYLWMAALTGRRGRSFVVAALFAVHPLHVESVAWISERKDVLCTFFGFLAILAYSRYAKQPGPGRYLAVLVLFALGLLAKPMLVTLPFVLLLLDRWPLRRVGPATDVSWSRVVYEKIPFWVLSAASCIVTYVAQQSGGAVKSLESLPLWVRAVNAPIAYVAYLWKTLVPVGLSVLYPHPATAVSVVQGVLALLGLIAATVGLLYSGRRGRPYLPVGWFWFLGTLVPVIGLVQVGAQAFADRYTYLPHVGLFVLVVWIAANVAQERQMFLSAVAIVAVLGLALTAHQQVWAWRNTHTLFAQALQHTSDNWVAHDHVGVALLREGAPGAAESHFREALRIRPEFYGARGRYNLGLSLAGQGSYGEALIEYERAVRLDPGFAEVHNDMGLVLYEMGRIAEAEASYDEALRLEPGLARAHFNLGVLHESIGDLAAAEADYRSAMGNDPSFAQPVNNLGSLLARRGDYEEAARLFVRALELDPAFDEARGNLELTRGLLSR